MRETVLSRRGLALQGSKMADCPYEETGERKASGTSSFAEELYMNRENTCILASKEVLG